MKIKFTLLLSMLFLLVSCQPVISNANGQLRVLAIESFLADIAQNVSGNRLKVDSLVPVNVDPHAYQVSPQDVLRINDADVLIINGANLETFLGPVLQNTNRKQQVITASAGLSAKAYVSGQDSEIDSHFWLDPNNVIVYVENIRAGLANMDPTGASAYENNSRKFSAELVGLDDWIRSQVSTIPKARRLLVTNHETLGYFAQRYGFTVIGAIIPSVSSGSSPSAQEMAALVNQIRASGAPAIFLEIGSNPQLADQIAAETNVKVITDLYTHSLSAAGGPAATYIDMMKHNVNTIVEALR